MSFCRRVDSQKVNKKTFEALICAGALDSFGSARSQLFGQLPQAMEAAGQHIANLSSGQNDMFGLPLTEEIVSLKSGFPTWTARKALEMERHSLGFYLTGHPMAHHRSEISQLVSESIAQTRPTPERVVTLSGLVQGLRTFQNRRGETMAFFQLDDGTGFADVSVFPDTYGQFRSALSSNGIVLTRGLTGVDDRSGLLSLKIEGIWTLKEARERALTSLFVSLPQGVAGAKIIQDLQGMLRKFVPGPTNINIEYLNQEGDSLSMSLGDQWRVQPDEDLIESLLTLAGESGVKFLYRSSLLTAQNLSKIDNLAA
jgi:DNA polymerase-3 subunit alpha